MLGLHDHTLEHLPLCVKMGENRSQDLLGYLAAPIGRMLAVHQHRAPFGKTRAHLRVFSQAITLRFTQPFPRLSNVGVIEVSDRRLREWLAERGHAVLPLLFPDHRQPFDVGEVPNVESDVLP